MLRLLPILTKLAPPTLVETDLNRCGDGGGCNNESCAELLVFEGDNRDGCCGGCPPGVSGGVEVCMGLTAFEDEVISSSAITTTGRGGVGGAADNTDPVEMEYLREFRLDCRTGERVAMEWLREVLLVTLVVLAVELEEAGRRSSL